MMLKFPVILLLAAAAVSSAEESRERRSLQPGALNINNKNQPWQLDPHIDRDNKGNTRTDVNIKHHGQDHDFDAGWSKVVRGPNKAKPTWHAGGTIRWRRSLQPGAPNVNNKDQPWQLDPHIERDDRGNTRTDVNIKHHGQDHDFDAGWSKVVRGPNKAKPTWHAGGTIRWRRSLQPGASKVNNNDQPYRTYRWRRSPESDYPDVDIREQNEKGEVENNFRWRRSAEESSDKEDEEEEPWQFNPTLERSNDGNTKADINLKRDGDDHDFEASWLKVVDGPGRAKPTWKVGGSFRW